ncbi:MAG: hypothetical protein WBB28_01615 [Crinalium sp.]
MPQKFEASLKHNRPTLFVPYPADYAGEKSGDESDESFSLSVRPRYLTEDEIHLAEALCKKLPYPQIVMTSGAVLLSEGDPLLEADQDYLDELELSLGVANTRSVGNGTRATVERVLLIREAGYKGNGHKLLLPVN